MAVASLLAWPFQGAMAAPEDDYRQGVAAYRRGDVIGAMSALRPAAKAGHAPSQVHLAFILESADFAEQAAPLYAAAAGQGSADGHAGLAGLLLIGRGIAKDEKRALQHFSKAAEGGHALASEVLATAYLKGQLGSLSLAEVPAAEAGAAVRRAADAGHVPSMEGLARAYRTGGLGLGIDPAQAVQWERRGAEVRAARAAAPAAGASAAASAAAARGATAVAAGAKPAP